MALKPVPPDIHNPLKIQGRAQTADPSIYTDIKCNTIFRPRRPFIAWSCSGLHSGADLDPLWNCSGTKLSQETERAFSRPSFLLSDRNGFSTDPAASITCSYYL